MLIFYIRSSTLYLNNIWTPSSSRWENYLFQNWLFITLVNGMYFSEQLDTFKVQSQIQKCFLMSTCLCIVNIIAIPECFEPSAELYSLGEKIHAISKRKERKWLVLFNVFIGHSTFFYVKKEKLWMLSRKGPLKDIISKIRQVEK